MLDAKTQRERLGFDKDAAIVQHLEGVARAVAHGQHHVVTLQRFAVRQLQRAHLALIDLDVVDPRFETHFTTQFVDGRTHLFHHADEAERADVRPAQIQDVVRRTGLDEFVQHLAAIVVRILDLAVQLAVGERPGPAFAELHVGFGVEHALAPQAEGVLGAFAHGLAAFRMMGRKPICARISPANRPHGPMPITTGRRKLPCSGAFVTKWYAMSGVTPQCGLPARRLIAAASSVTSTSTIYVSLMSARLRASCARRNTV